MRQGFCLFAVAFVAMISRSEAHDTWANGDPIPAWIKAACCGSADARRLTADQVHGSYEHPDATRYYDVDGYRHQVTVAAIPSEDGDYWVFYRTDPSGSQSRVFCFFVPMDF
jgi:hypothetical protein